MAMDKVDFSFLICESTVFKRLSLDILQQTRVLYGRVDTSR